MAIATGDKFPSGILRWKGADGPAEVETDALLAGRKVVLFGLPGAFTGTCSSAHVPSFMRVRDALGQKGVDEVICLAVNDIFVMDAWDQDTGAGKAGVRMLADPDASVTKAMGLEFSAPPPGLHDRCKRCAMVIEDGVVTLLNIEDNPGVCELTAGETLLEAL